MKQIKRWMIDDFATYIILCIPGVNLAEVYLALGNLNNTGLLESSSYELFSMNSVTIIFVR
jgi:hypothetical protein